jgi:hypothetical protein
MELQQVAGVDRAHTSPYQKLIKKVKRIAQDYLLSGLLSGAGVDSDGVALFSPQGPRTTGLQEAEHGRIQGDGPVGGRILLH